GNGSSPAFPAAAELWLTGRCLRLLRFGTTGGHAPKRAATDGVAQGKAQQKVEPLRPFLRPSGMPFDAAGTNQGISDTPSASDTSKPRSVIAGLRPNVAATIYV